MVATEPSLAEKIPHDRRAIEREAAELDRIEAARDVLQRDYDKPSSALLAQRERNNQLRTNPEAAASVTPEQFEAELKKEFQFSHDTGRAKLALQQFDQENPNRAARRDALEARERELATGEKFEDLKATAIECRAKLVAYTASQEKLEALVKAIVPDWPAGAEPKLLDRPVPSALRLRSVCWPNGVFTDGEPLLRRGPLGDERLPRVSCARWLAAQIAKLLGEASAPTTGPVCPKIAGEVLWL